MTACGLPPIGDARATVLVLGSMPGIASLAAQQYYAHPRNLFWPFAAEILGFAPSPDYDVRIARLTRARVALWDVLATCTRASSLDADITDDVPNDFATFFARHPKLVRVCFNGGTARRLYDRHVTSHVRALDYRSLPSTSPANASITRAAKLAAWRAIEL